MVGRSQVVQLTLISLIGTLTAASMLQPGQQMRRNFYTSRADCERDYSPAQCTGSSGGFGSAGYGWHGPSYLADRNAPEARNDPGPGRFGLARAIVSVRGGFGAFGRVLHAVG